MERENITNVPTLKIYKLTEAQYRARLEAGKIDENAFYFTDNQSNNTADSYMVKVNKSYSEETHEVIYTTEDFNWEDLCAAINAGKDVFCRIIDMFMQEEGNISVEDCRMMYFTTEENYVQFIQETLNYTTLFDISADGNMQYLRQRKPSLDELPMVLELKLQTISTQDGETHDVYVVQNNITANAIFSAITAGRMIIGHFKRSGYLQFTDYAYYVSRDNSVYGGREVYFPHSDWFYCDAIANCNRLGKVNFVNEIW